MKKANAFRQPLYAGLAQRPLFFLVFSLFLFVMHSSVLAAPVTNGTGTKATVTATQLTYATEPAGSVSGIALATQPVVNAEDAFGNLDLDYTSTVTLAETSNGTLTGATQAATNGVATFTGLVYSATADGESFTLVASGSGLTGAIANAINSDVVATKLAFTTQPAPTSFGINTVTAFTTVPVVQALDADNVVDTDFSEVISISGGGMGNSTFTNQTATASSGVATFTGLSLNYDSAETFPLIADDQAGVDTDLDPVNSTSLTVTANAAPTIVGTSANQAVNDNASLTPFSVVTLSDSEGDNLSVTLALDDDSKGTLSTTSIASGTASSVQDALQAVTFTPTANRVAVDSTETTTITVSVSDGVNTAVTDNTTTVVSTSINDIPTDIALSNNTVAKGVSNIGALSTTDADTGESFTYSLVAGAGDGDNASFTISSANLQANTTLNAGTYNVRIQTDDGHSGGTFAKTFAITVTDTVAPTLAAITPADDATEVAINTDLVLTLNESIVKGTGNILIKKISDNSTVETIDVTGGQVTISGAIITIDPSVILAVSTEYAIEVPATAFADSANNFFAGITDNTSWSFTTSANKVVPSNHPTNFTATANAISITTTWTDAVAGVLPDSYIVLCSTTNSFTPPVNGIAQADDADCADGSGVQNIAAGSQSATWSGLTTGTEYFFTIYPFTNTNANVLYKTDGTALTASATPSVDADATVTAGDSVTEPVDLPSTTDTALEAINLFDFKVTDGGTSDGVATEITQIVVRTSGTGEFSKVTWRLTGNDASNVSGVYDSINNTLTFSNLAISIANGENETYIINAFFSDTSGITDNSTFLLSIDGANGDVTVNSAKTQMQPDAP